MVDFFKVIEIVSVKVFIWDTTSGIVTENFIQRYIVPQIPVQSNAVIWRLVHINLS